MRPECKNYGNYRLAIGVEKNRSERVGYPGANGSHWRLIRVSKIERAAVMRVPQTVISGLPRSVERLVDADAFPLLYQH